MTEDAIVDVRFAREKYDSELLVDVAATTELVDFIVDARPHRLGFYDILLATRGRGTLWLDSSELEVTPGSLLFTSPGQVRSWRVRGLEGVCLFFEPEFLSEFFNDARFLGRLHFFHTHDAPVTLALDADREAWLTTRLAGMRRELRPLRRDSRHLLRAALYEVLVRLNRWCAEASGLEAAEPERGPAAGFRQLVEVQYRKLHRVREYADRLAVTPGHLNHIARRHLGISAGAVIRSRIVLEAKRLLLHSEARVASIAAELGFEDRSYFSRFFRREVGVSPTAYRRKIREKYHS